MDKSRKFKSVGALECAETETAIYETETDWLERAQSGNGQESKKWKAKRETIISRHKTHPLRIENVLDLFPDCAEGKSRRTKASKVMKDLSIKKLIRHSGTIPWSSIGRNHDLYYWHKLPKHLWKHEALLTDVFDAMDWPPCTRGIRVDQDLRPDAHLFLGEQEYLMEMDTGLMKRKQIHSRFCKLKDVELTVLIITKDKERLDDLIAWSSQLQNPLFKTWDEAVANPWEDWIDPEGGLHEVLPTCCKDVA